MYMQLDVATDLFQELAMCQTNCGIAHVGTEQSRVSEGDVRDETSF